MSSDLLLDNVVAYSLQIGLLVGVAGFVPALLRLRQPGFKLVYWQILLAACLLLPLQPWKQAMASGTVEVTSVITAVRPAHGPATLPGMPRSEIALALLLGGVALRLGWLAMGFWKLRRYRRHSLPLEPAPAWSAEASLRISDEIKSPVTFGWRKPVVLLPAAFPQLEGTVQDAILCHEVLHVRRGDWLFTVGEEVVRAVLWFHPAIWWLLGKIGLAREQEVDRLSIEITGRRDDYMDALLAIAGARTGLDLAPAPLFLRKRHLRQRVVLILQEAHMSKTKLISAMAAGLGILVAACWLVTGAFPLMATPQVVNDAQGVTVSMNGATLLHRTAVNYPASALQHGVQGTLAVEVKLDSSGNVSDARVLSGPDELRKTVLESVLQWHFAQDTAGTTRVVQIAFEAPQQIAVNGPNLAPPGAMVAVPRPRVNMPSPTPSHIGIITVTGLPEAARNQLLASLPVHEGDEASMQNLQQLNKAVAAFDEHLIMRTSRIGAAGDSSLTVEIAAPGAIPPRIKVGGNVQGAMILKKVTPEYPALAKQAHVEGIVHLAAVIGKDGAVTELHSLGGPALLIQSAMDAVKQWVYKVTLLNGEPVTVETTIDVSFTLAQ